MFEALGKNHFLKFNNSQCGLDFLDMILKQGHNVLQMLDQIFGICSRSSMALNIGFILKMTLTFFL